MVISLSRHSVKNLNLISFSTTFSKRLNSEALKTCLLLLHFLQLHVHIQALRKPAEEKPQKFGFIQVFAYGSSPSPSPHNKILALLCAPHAHPKTKGLAGL